MGNLVYQKLPKNSIDRIIWELKCQITKLKDRNKKLAGAVRRNFLMHVDINKNEFIQDTYELSLGDIIEITCVKENYKIGDAEFYWPYTLYKSYIGLIVCKDHGYVKVLFMNYANNNMYHFKRAYQLDETFDISDEELEAGIFKVRTLFSVEDSIECKKR